MKNSILETAAWYLKHIHNVLVSTRLWYQSHFYPEFWVEFRREVHEGEITPIPPIIWVEPQKMIKILTLNAVGSTYWGACFLAAVRWVALFYCGFVPSQRKPWSGTCVLLAVVGSARHRLLPWLDFVFQCSLVSTKGPWVSVSPAMVEQLARLSCHSY